jgi:hypothetical protein
MTAPRIGIALGGGAARGWAHIGILRWLREHDLFPDVMQARTEIAKKNVEYIFLRIMRVLLEQDELYFKFNEFFGSTDEREESILSIMVSFLKETGFTVHIGDFLKDDGFKVTWEEEEEDVT